MHFVAACRGAPVVARRHGGVLIPERLGLLMDELEEEDHGAVAPELPHDAVGF